MKVVSTDTHCRQSNRYVPHPLHLLRIIFAALVCGMVIAALTTSTADDSWPVDPRVGGHPVPRVGSSWIRLAPSVTDSLPPAGPACGALAEKRVDTFLAILGEEVASNRVPSDLVGLSKRHLELSVEHLLTTGDRR